VVEDKVGKRIEKKRKKIEKKRKEKIEKNNGYYGLFILLDHQEKLFCQKVQKTISALQVNLLHR
jgi:hypothetical protein